MRMPYSFNNFACKWIARYYGLFIHGTLAYIKLKFCLPRVGIRTVTGKAMRRQQWTNIPVKVDALIRMTDWCQTKKHNNCTYDSQV